MSEIEHWAAFSTDPAGGNPAGVVRDATGWNEERMRRTAAELGYAESAFVVTESDGARRIRYFSPVAEVPFCGHATVASAAALAAHEGDGDFVFRTSVGDVEIVTRTEAGTRRISFTSVEPQVAELPADALAEVLALLGLTPDDLDPAWPAALAYAGNWHPLIVLRESRRFDAFGFDAVDARRLLDERGWPATLIVLWREDAGRWHARNVFPVGTLDEDPATGAAAAATGGYLRARGYAPASLEIAQGAHVGRPSELAVTVPTSGGIVVSGAAVRIL